MSRGTFIVIEGGDGSGKTTMIEKLQEAFPEIVYTHDPGGTAFGESVRALLLSDNARDIDSRTEMLLFHASRAQLVVDVIKPALEEGKTVVCNRFELSSIAYQIYGREKPELMPMLRSISETILEGCIPDTCIFLDVLPEVGLSRIVSRAADHFETENTAFHKRVREGYKKHLGEFGIPVVIDASKPVDKVWAEVKKAVQLAQS